MRALDQNGKDEKRGETRKCKPDQRSLQSRSTMKIRKYQARSKKLVLRIEPTEFLFIIKLTDIDEIIDEWIKK